MGAVTDFGASEATNSGDPPRNLPISTALAMAVTEPTSSDARNRQGAGLDPLQIAIERNGQRDGGGAEQEMDELRPREIGLVADAGGLEHDNDQNRGQRDQIDSRMPAACLRQAVGDEIGDEGQGEPGERRGGEIDKEVRALEQVADHGLFASSPAVGRGNRRRENKRKVSAVAAIAKMVDRATATPIATALARSRSK